MLFKSKTEFFTTLLQNEERCFFIHCLNSCCGGGNPAKECRREASKNSPLRGGGLRSAIPLKRLIDKLMRVNDAILLILRAVVPGITILKTNIIDVGERFSFKIPYFSPINL